MQSVKIETVKKGDYIKRTATARGVYVRGDYVKACKGYECHDTEDINKSLIIKTGKPVFIGFTY